MIHIIDNEQGVNYLTRAQQRYMHDTTEDKKKHKDQDERIKTESVLRETSSNYIRLIGDADRKARIMLIVNSLMVTFGVTIMSKIVIHNPFVWISATLLISGNLLALFFTVQSVRPEFKNHLGDDTKMEDNILHYTKTTEYTLEKYTREMLDTLHDNDKKINAVIKDLYFYGNLLSLKYKLMKISYRFFYWGIAVAVISYLIILFISRN